MRAWLAEILNDGDGATDRWSKERAAEWQSRRGFRTGCNFYPSTAINQLEMWQAESWDPATIDRELGWAADLGMSIVRTYLHDLAYAADPDGFLARVDEFLALAEGHGIQALLVFFDDCWSETGGLGPQPAPRPSVHNSGWLRSPLKPQRDPAHLPELERYVKAVLTRFQNDPRVDLWDLYNEPGNSKYDEASLPLLKAVFRWAREVAPSQPISAGLWYDHLELNRFQLQNSDVITFHNYASADFLREEIAELRSFGRPLICTEWMARRQESRPESHLPIFREHGVTAINWGLVRGKTNTIWGWETPEGAPEPDPWFHDLLHPDGTAYSPAEADAFRLATRP